MRQDRFLIALGCFFKLLESVMELFIPLIMADILNEGEALGSSFVTSKVLTLLAIIVLGFIFAFCCQRTAARVGANFGEKARVSLYNHVNTLSFSELDKFTSAKLATRLTTDVAYVQQSLSMFIRLATRSPFIAVGSIIMVFTLNKSIAFIFLGTVALLSLILFFIMKKSARLQNLAMKKFDVLSEQSKNAVAGNRVIRAFSQEDNKIDSYERSAEDYRVANTKTNRVLALSSPLTTLIMNLVIAVVLTLGSRFVYAGDMDGGTMTAIITYFLQLILALTVLANLLLIFAKADSSAVRILEVLNLSSSIKYGDGDIPNDGNFDIQVKNLTFKFQDSSKDVLSDISFSLPYGSSLGIIGVTGSGKSTLSNLLTRRYDPKSGEVLIGGVDLRTYSKKALDRMFGVASQRAVIFSKSAFENIALSGDVSREDATIASKIADAHSFISTYFDGYDHVFLEGGKNLSGGQKQRISIARAIAAKKHIYIFDNSLSALDNVTEKKVRNNLLSLSGTKVIISQRIPSVSSLDNIIFLEKGKIECIGTHEYLLTHCESYRNMAKSQGVLEGER